MMPAYSAKVLSDKEATDIWAYINQPGSGQDVPAAFPYVPAVGSVNAAGLNH